MVVNVVTKQIMAKLCTLNRKANAQTRKILETTAWDTKTNFAKNLETIEFL